MKFIVEIEGYTQSHLHDPVGPFDIFRAIEREFQRRSDSYLSINVEAIDLPDSQGQEQPT